MTQALDLDHNGRVDWDEFAAVMARRLLQEVRARSSPRMLCCSPGAPCSPLRSAHGPSSLAHACAVRAAAASARRATRASSCRRTASPHQEGEAEIDMALGLFEPRGEGEAEVSIPHLRELLTTTGLEPLTEAEFTQLMRVADPQGQGRLTYEQFRELPCWRPLADPLSNDEVVAIEDAEGGVCVPA